MNLFAWKKMNRIIPILEEEEFKKIEEEVANYCRRQYIKLQEKVGEKFLHLPPLILDQFIMFNAMRNLRMILIYNLLQIKKEDREKAYNVVMEDFKKTVFELIEQKESKSK